MKIIEVTEFSVELLKAVNRLLPQLTNKKVEITESGLREIVQSKNTALFVAENQNQFLGMLTLITVPIPTGIRCIIEDVVVDEKLRGYGAGKALMDAAIKKAQEMGCDNINLTSSPERVAANALYKKLGFKIRETNVYRKNLK